MTVISDDMRYLSIELAMSKKAHASQAELGEIYDPVLCTLTAKPTITYAAGKVTWQLP